MILSLAFLCIACTHPLGLWEPPSSKTPVLGAGGITGVISDCHGLCKLMCRVSSWNSWCASPCPPRCPGDISWSHTKNWCDCSWLKTGRQESAGSQEPGVNPSRWEILLCDRCKTLEARSLQRWLPWDVICARHTQSDWKYSLPSVPHVMGLLRGGSWTAGLKLEKEIGCCTALLPSYHLQKTMCRVMETVELCVPFLCHSPASPPLLY